MTASFWFVAFRSAQSNNAAAARRWLGGTSRPFPAARLDRFRPLGLPEPSSEREVKSRLAGLVRSFFFAVRAFLQPATRETKLPYFLAAAPVLHLHGHSPENETHARLQVGSAVARLPLQRLSPAPSGCCMANVVAPDFATATTFICMVSSPDVAALNLFASALLDFDFVLLLLAAS